MTETPTPEGLLPGDILTRDSDLLWLPAHDALYVGGAVIIDSMPDGGVQYRTLDGFREDADQFLIVQRLAEWSQSAAQGALDYAISVIGTPYDFWFFAGKDTKDRMYCSELVWRAYLSQGYDLDSNGGSWVWPSEIMWSPLLVEVDIALDPTLISSKRELTDVTLLPGMPASRRVKIRPGDRADLSMRGTDRLEEGVDERISSRRDRKE